MTANAPTRTPARFVRIRGLTSSTHLNGELARLGKWLPQRARWEVSLCDSINVGPTEEVVLAIKETNVEDVDDDAIVAWIRERLDDVGLVGATSTPENPEGGLNARLGRLDFLLESGMLGEALPTTVLAPLAKCTVDIVKEELSLEKLPSYAQFASHWAIGPWFVHKTKQGLKKGDRVHQRHALELCKAGCFGPLVRLAHRAVLEADTQCLPAIDTKASFEAFCRGDEELCKTLIDMQLAKPAGCADMCDHFARDVACWSSMSLAHEDCARAILADPELDPTHPNHRQVTRALIEMCTRDDVFVKSQCMSMMCVEGIFRWRQKLCDDKGDAFFKSVVERVRAAEPTWPMIAKEVVRLNG